ncbi:MAG: 1,4-dihydroxy-2-naphthoate polyprenyltransferase, partial [Actinomycetales bacterium]
MSRTNIGIWSAGARPRTLPVAVAGVLAGCGAALHIDAFLPLRALLALIVAVALQVGVNYANDYSDGIRGTDNNRIGPVRLVGQGLASAASVRRAALLAFLVGAIAGLALVALTGRWWLLLLGAACLLAGWFYTGGPRPYGYLGLGELFVFVFFGIVPVLGTCYVQADRISAPAVLAACGVGLLACAVLLTNNLRDIPGDALVGKRTLAVRMGAARTRWSYLVILIVAAMTLVGIAVLTQIWVLITLLVFVLAVKPLRLVLGG